MNAKILVIEDDKTLRETLAYNLEHNGYQVEVAADGYAGLQAARSYHPDLILLDVMLPGLDGFEVTRILRSEANTPILMLTARDEEIDRVLGLEMGADDYLTKPFSMHELLARVKAMLRRVRLIQEDVDTQGVGAQKTIAINNLVIDPIRHEARLDDLVLVLKPKEYELLLFMVRHQGQVLSRQLILERVWGWDFSGGTRTVDVHIRWLRSKIESDSADPKRIITVRGTGYMLDG